MKKRRIGKTEMYVNPIGLGCMGFSHAYGIAEKNEVAIEKIKKAFEMGYDFFDTAEFYKGEDSEGILTYNETLVGEALKDVRDKVYISTKFGLKDVNGTTLLDSDPNTIRASVEGSLERLQTDSIDLYFQHRMDPNVEPEVVATVMKELIEEGKIKAWGISETTEEYLRRAHSVCPVSAIQNRYSMMATWHDNLFDVCEELGISYIAFSPIANGFLSGKFSDKTEFSEKDWRSRMPQYQESGYQKAQDLLDLLNELSVEKECTMTQISLAWILHKNDFLIPIPGSRKLERMLENFESKDVVLSDEEMSRIDTLLNSIDFEIFG